MKTDNYLNLCLEQAAKSPLRYRHGAIVVRGGKVIGQGFNDFRSGFNGGALKTGRLPLRSLDGPAIAEMKKKPKLKRELKEPQEETNTTFAPFETMGGGGKIAETPLSMHSEMMAIHSALSASSTMALRAVSSQKPYFKLSGSSKRKARLRQDAIKSYVEAVCQAALVQCTTAQCNGQSQVQEWRFESSSSRSGHNEFGVRRQGRGPCGSANREVCNETPNEEREKESQQNWQQTQQWASRAPAQTIFT